MLNESQVSQSVTNLGNWTGTPASSETTYSFTGSDPLEVYLAEMEAAMADHDKIYGRYDLGRNATDSVAA